MQKYSLVPLRRSVAMEMGILINAETDGASVEIRSCWELLCAKPHRAAPHRTPVTGTASKGRHRPAVAGAAAEQGSRIPTHVSGPSCWWPLKEPPVQTYPELLLFWGENTRFSFCVVCFFFFMQQRELCGIRCSESSANIPV